LLYCVANQYHATHIIVASSERKCTAKAAKQLTTLQRAGALAITGGLRTSPTDVLDAAAYLLPATLTTDKWCHRSFVRLTMLPSEHPLYKAMASKVTCRTKRHKSPIISLLGQYGYDPNKIKKIPSAARNPEQTGKLPFRIVIPENREDSVREAREAVEEVQVFSDGSAFDGKVGAAAILIRPGKPPHVLHLHLRPESEHTVHEAELVGVLLGLHLIGTERRSSTTCMLGVDNQAAIKAFHSDLRRPGHHIAREAILLANRIQKRRSKVTYSLTMQWTAGHEGIAGNEAADKEAKKAAKGKTSEKHLLPPYLRKPLLINPAAIKRSYVDKLKKKWTEDWRNSQGGQRAAAIDKTAPSKKFLLAISQNSLSRQSASRIAQFRLFHAPVNHYLKRIGKVDSARCPACGAEDETIEHYLLACPSYAHERWALMRQARKLRKQLSLETLLEDHNMVASLANYIDATQRFSEKGEHAYHPNKQSTQQRAQVEP